MATGSTTRSRPVVALLGSPEAPPPVHLAELEDIADIRHTTADELGTVLPGADALVVWDFFSRALHDNWRAADSLRWVHVCAAGVDSLLFDELVASDVVVTNAHGVFDRPIAEFVLASILARDKRLHESMALQSQRVWKWRETRSTTGTSALVIGTGGIGREIARLLSAVGIQVTGAGRRARDHDPDFGVVRETAGLSEFVGDFDTVIAIAPLTAETEHMIGADVLAAMRADAHFINVGRGALVDEPALIEALQAGRIGAASLDVVATEPLPADSPLWAMDNVAISAHLSGDVVGWRDVLSAQLLDNLRRYADAGPGDLERHLVNVVDKARGYVVRRDPRPA
ncbi:D-2-hydroxyacid dehydrogenase [Gordonia sp. DT219]|uniref:D-2-hydroxyacid dehydrogenase n=1 Tax=Gordonia sp. DT219 TaxID=3416658 RepID=UPI003CF9736F